MEEEAHLGRNNKIRKIKKKLMIKKTFLFLVVISFVGPHSLYAQKVVIIGLDGISSEGFKASKHPNIDKLFADGVLSLTTRPVMPSVTLPNWTSHLTGSGPEEHGVVNNKWTLQNHELMPIDTDKDGYYPSIFKLLKEQVPKIKTAYYCNWADLINSINKKYLDEISFQYNDKYDSSYSKAEQGIEINIPASMKKSGNYLWVLKVEE